MDSDEPVDDSRPTKKSRLFIARLKKTRCDEKRPTCGPCKNAGLECNYGERKATKNEVTLSMILHKLERMDAKIDSLSSTPTSDVRFDHPAELPTSPSTPKLCTTPISFSSRRMFSWPAMRDLLPPSLESVPAEYALNLEENRPKLPVRVEPQADLSPATVRELSEAYFATFNLANPVLDRRMYFQQTMRTAISGGFGYDAHSCCVLMTMALGSFGIRAVDECRPDDLSNGHTTQSNTDGAAEPTGLVYYNEARKRVGFLEGDHCMQACQFYLLAAVYHGQLLRPVDCWSMTMRAAVICLKYWTAPRQVDDWTSDMFSRLFWITVMYQTILTHELTGLPISKIHDMEDQVPLPKFVPYLSSSPADTEEEEESFYHYHFLSQIAHRLFLTRVYTSIYHAMPTGDYPNTALARELYHQLERWRSQLPSGLRFDEETPVDGAGPLGDVLVVALLRSRYFVAQYHLGRPFLYKALHQPSMLTEEDVQRCREALQATLKWADLALNMLSIKSCVPLAFPICGQTFGQLVLMYAFRYNPQPALQQLLPTGWEHWAHRGLQVLRDYSDMSPAIAKDYEIASTLFSMAST
ncbi:uncharacterized protein AB675_11508 [Cyphellophora attinorum]|uniref:Zn(2)-C6 fungal-type domain-containing protein n=1 Tax=Cyphellophora attinorum TaxID=1664694 RepID=A0A0N1H912_9EURO|nr:uncharacterized protein AB675_11508 [Phialophora attinorum]KPI39966.1 hypothetical protein AB675_11508 [Phialophora attinorum]